MDSSRKAIIFGLSNEFQVAAQPVEEFDGIPILMPQLATYYGFENDPKHMLIANSRGENMQISSVKNSTIFTPFLRRFSLSELDAKSSKVCIGNISRPKMSSQRFVGGSTCRAQSATAPGMLLYAKTDEDVPTETTWSMSGNSIGIGVLDLNQDFNRIRARLDDIVATHFPAIRKASQDTAGGLSWHG